MMQGQKNIKKNMPTADLQNIQIMLEIRRSCGSASLCILLSTTNKMQRYTILFIIVNALHVSGGLSAHHQELKNYTHSVWYMYSS